MYRKWTLNQYALDPDTAADSLYAIMLESLNQIGISRLWIDRFSGRCTGFRKPAGFQSDWLARRAFVSFLCSVLPACCLELHDLWPISDHPETGLFVFREPVDPVRSRAEKTRYYLHHASFVPLARSVVTWNTLPRLVFTTIWLRPIIFRELAKVERQLPVSLYS